MNFIKKYWFLALLAFVATTLVVINFFLPKKEAIPSIPATQESVWQGVVPGQTKQEELFNLLGAPDPKLSDFSTNTLAYPRAEGSRPNEVVIDSGVVSLAREKVLVGRNYNEYKQKYGPAEAELYGPEQEAGFKLYLYSQKGFGVLASEGDGTILEIWHFMPNTTEEILKTAWGKDLSTEPENTPEL